MGFPWFLYQRKGTLDVCLALFLLWFEADFLLLPCFCVHIDDDQPCMRTRCCEGCLREKSTWKLRQRKFGESETV